jgi:arylsulfatase A-like enzyme/tetratricopeptide (TPR) repeat protein
MRRGQVRRRRLRIGPGVIILGGLVAAGLIGSAVWRYGRGGAPAGGFGQAHVVPGLRAAPRFPAARGAFSGCNLLWITLDTTRADYLGCYGATFGATPNLDALARRGVLLSEAITPAPITLPAHCSMFTGLYPHRHGVRLNGLQRLGAGQQTLAEILAQRGYKTAAVLGAFVLDSRFGLDQGFDTYLDDFDKAPASEHFDPEAKANQVTDRAVAWLRGHAGQPFFLWAHYFDAHFPYEPPPPYADRYRANPYAGEIAFVDTELGRLLKALGDLGHMQDTLIVVAGDHGEGLGQQLEVAHGYLLFNATLHVPVIMVCGERLGGGIQVPGLVSLTDLMPTVLALLGLDVPAGLDGADLTALPEPHRAVYAETLYGLAEHGWSPLFAIVRDEQKYIYGPHPLLFDLARDPLEATNLVASRPDLAADLAGELTKFFGDELSRAGAPAATEKLDDTDLAKLRALGYVGQGSDDYGPGARPDPVDMVPLVRQVETAQYEGLIGKRPVADAAAAIENVLREHPDFCAGYRYLADLLSAAADTTRAESAARRGLQRCPDNLPLLISLARIKLKQRDGEQAAALFRRIVAVYPDSPAHRAALGVALMLCRRYDEACDVFAGLLPLAPDDVNVVQGLVQAHLEAGRAEEGARLLSQQLTAHPGQVAVRMALAKLHRMQRRYDQAIQLLRAGVALMPEKGELSNALAATLLEVNDEPQRRAAEAAAVMERICQKTGFRYPQYLFTLSVAYDALGRHEDAIAAAQQAYQLAADGGQRDLAQRIARAIEKYRARS